MLTKPWTRCFRAWARPDYTQYSIVRETDGASPDQDHEVEPESYGDPSAEDGEEISSQPQTRLFTNRILLQIVSVSLLAFHTVASETLIPVFLAFPRSHGTPGAPPQDRIKSPLSLNGGFGMSSPSIGKVLFTQAVISVLVQIFVVARLVTRFGPLRTYRWTLVVYSLLYCLTPFVAEFKSPLSTMALLLDLWAKVLLVALGDVCSAILWVSCLTLRRNTSLVLKLKQNHQCDFTSQ